MRIASASGSSTPRGWCARQRSSSASACAGDPAASAARAVDERDLVAQRAGGRGRKIARGSRGRFVTVYRRRAVGPGGLDDRRALDEDERSGLRDTAPSCYGERTSMLDRCKVMAFLATRDGRRARAFYETTLGFTVLSDDGFALALDAGGTMVRIQKVDSFDAHPFTALGWEVPDIDRAVEQLSSAGVVFERFGGMDQNDRGVWRSPTGARVAWFKDPDGNTLSLTQR